MITITEHAIVSGVECVITREFESIEEYIQFYEYHRQIDE